MNPLYEKASGLMHEIIAAGIEAHRAMGPGLIESVYEWCLIKELESRGLHVSDQQHVKIRYKGFERKEKLRFDLLVEGCVLVEVKAVEAIHPIHKAQLLSYMKLLDVPVGLVLNFHQTKLTDDIARLILAGTDT